MVTGMGGLGAAEDKRVIDPDELREAFAEAHRQRYGYRDDGTEIELVTIRVSAFGAAPSLKALEWAEGPDEDAAPAATQLVTFDEGPLQTPLLIGIAAPGTASTALRCARWASRHCWSHRAGRGRRTVTARSNCGDSGECGRSHPRGRRGNARWRA